MSGVPTEGAAWQSELGQAAAANVKRLAQADARRADDHLAALQQRIWGGQQ